MTLIPVVDNDDIILGYKERGILKPTERYRVSALWITNSHGEILLAQRHRSKKHHPSCWGPAVAGTVEKGETYQSNILKEAKEEIGVSGFEFSLGPKTQAISGYLHFTQWFLLILDWPLDKFILEPQEVESIRWICPHLLKQEFTQNPKNFVPSFAYVLPLFL